MSMPPSLIKLSIDSISLWLPLFLPWPILIRLGVLYIPVGAAHRPALLSLLSEVHGTTIRINNSGHRINIAIL